MTQPTVNNTYFSGQGVVMLGTRDANGNPLGLRTVGNVSALTLGIEVSVFEHKESYTGVRGIDKKIVQEVNGSMSMVMESIDKENLALALYGAESAVAGDSETAEVLTTPIDGLWVPLAHSDVSNVVVNGSGGSPTYTVDDDYEVDLDSGMIRMISGGTGSWTDGSTVEVDYDYAGYDLVDGLTSSAAPERWMRFIGLNTADDNRRVIVDVFKASTSPLAELALINEELAQMTVEASILADTTRASGSQYFTQKILAAS